MSKHFIYAFFSGILLSSLFHSCTDESKGKLFGLRKLYPASLIRNHLLFSDRVEEFSFPVWFNDSLIRCNKISAITRRIYPKRLTEATRGDSLLAVPSEIIKYTFKSNGSVEKISRAFFYDDRKISEFHFLYNQSPDKFGFAEVKMDIGQTKTALPMEMSSADRIPLYQKSRATNRFIAFENQATGNFLYCIADKKFWGALDVDRYIRPNPSDVLLLGSSISPIKTYQVENKVSETNVTDFTYKKGSIKHFQTNQYPFHSRRSYVYDKRGYCMGFIDSTFSENSFLTRTISHFENNMLFSPTKIFHRKENSLGKLILINFEEFDYEYRK